MKPVVKFNCGQSLLMVCALDWSQAVAASHNHLRTTQTQEIGTHIQGAGSVSLSAGQDIQARAASMASQTGTPSLIAGYQASRSQEVQAQVQITQQFGMQASRAVGDCRA